MSKVPGTGKDHRYASRVAGGYNLIITLGASGLNYGGDPGPCRRKHAVRLREEGVGCEHGAARLLARLLPVSYTHLTLPTKRIV